MQQKEVLEGLIKKQFPDESKIIRGLEIGFLRGDLDVHLLNAIPNLNMYTIDPNPEKPQFIGSIADLPNKVSILDRLHIIELASDDAVKALKPFSFDFVWIDGDHEYEQCYKDIVNYLPLVKKLGMCGGHDIDGIIGGHNINPTDDNQGAHPGVRQAVTEVFGGKPADNGDISINKINLGDDFTWWVYV